jgi:phosphopantothenoylcysteine decarboxylase/phosphopantothenate--cysteine ligase
MVHPGTGINPHPYQRHRQPPPDPRGRALQPHLFFMHPTSGDRAGELPPRQRPSAVPEQPPPSTAPSDRGSPAASRRRLLITAGPTHEPIDAVRYLGNRSSGRLGIALADEAARRGWAVTLLLGPTARDASDSRIRVARFRTTADLEALLRAELPQHDILVMAAAVADYRPKAGTADLAGKRRRSQEGMVLELEATPDLLAACASLRRPDQLIVGFALEPRSEMLASAQSKLTRKNLDMIVANPLETMDGESIEAVVIGRDGSQRRTDGPVPKSTFAGWLMGIIESAPRHSATPPAVNA